MLFVVLCPGTPEGSTGSGSGSLYRGGYIKAAYSVTTNIFRKILFYF